MRNTQRTAHPRRASVCPSFILLVLLLLPICVQAAEGAAARIPATDDELLDLIQRRTLEYFLDFAHPVSGLAAERNSTPDTVTSGGSGFALMAMLAGIERGWLSREDVRGRCLRAVEFLGKAERFHGAWPHWLDGRTGTAIPFSRYDDGGDIVETSFLVQGLLTVRAYFDSPHPDEKRLRQEIDRLWRSVEWDWYTRGGNVLYWHWSPRHGWKMNLPIRGYNECLITYVLAASSPTHSVDPRVYHEGWATGPAFINSRTYFDAIRLPLGPDYGGPLFFTHYSFLGLDPRGLKDRYADYWLQNISHAMINYLHCARNPSLADCSRHCWGLTSSDNPWGYDAHSPVNDKGVIAPTAALSSLPYAPRQSLRAARHFLGWHGERLFGEHGFRDAFCVREGWTADSTLAIDQGPIVVMIENHRSAFFWRLFMSVPEIRNGLARLGFTFPQIARPADFNRVQGDEQ